MLPNVGTHVSFTKDVSLTELIVSLEKKYPNYDIPNFQVYLGPKIGGNSRVLDDKDIESARKIIGKKGFFIHSCLTNYLSCPRKFKHYCASKIVNELRHMAKFPLSGVVIHPGTMNADGVKRDLEETLNLIIESIVKIYESGDKNLGTLLLENSAGEGSKVPKNLDEIKYIIKSLETILDRNGEPISKRVGVCIDTCHIFAAGAYDFSKIEEIEKFKMDFQKKIGLKYLKLIHLNDSKDEFDSHRDRHEIIGLGNIWKKYESLSTLFRLFRRVPFVCETKDFGKCLPFILKAKELM